MWSAECEGTACATEKVLRSVRKSCGSLVPPIPSPHCLTEPLQTPQRARCLGFQRRHGLDEFPPVNKLRGATVAVTTRRPGRRGEHRRDQ